MLISSSKKNASKLCEVPGSNLHSDAGYFEVFSDFTPSHQGNRGLLFYNRTLPLSCVLFTFYYYLTIPRSRNDAVEKTTLNIPRVNDEIL